METIIKIAINLQFENRELRIKNDNNRCYQNQEQTEI